MGLLPSRFEEICKLSWYHNAKPSEAGNCHKKGAGLNVLLDKPKNGLRFSLKKTC